MELRRRRSLLVAAALIWAGGGLVWAVVAGFAAARLPAPLAVALAPWSSTAQLRSAEAALIEGRNEAALRPAERAVAAAPFNAAALRALGLTQARAGRETQAAALLEAAAAKTWRDDPSHLWLLERKLKAGDLAAAVPHADALMRRDQERYAPVADLLAAAVVARPAARGPVSESLAASPPWRSRFIRQVLNRPGGADALLDLGEQMKAHDGGLSLDERGAVFSALVRERRHADAARVRDELLGPGVFDGEFAGRVAPRGMGWVLRPRPGAGVRIGEDQALVLEHDGFSGGRVVEQVVALAPGRTVIRAAVSGAQAKRASRPYWRLACLGGAELGRVEPMAGQGLWREFVLEVEIPAAGCALQTLSLELAPGDRRTTSVWRFDGVTAGPPRSRGENIVSRQD